MISVKLFPRFVSTTTNHTNESLAERLTHTSRCRIYDSWIEPLINVISFEVNLRTPTYRQCEIKIENPISGCRLFLSELSAQQQAFHDVTLSDN
jgi:hypothetical protein